MTTLVLTAIGDDQAGLVEALSGVIAAHGANWDESHMAQLAGKFAGIVQVTVPDAQVDALVGALQPLQQDGLLDIAVSRAEDVVPDPPTTRDIRLHLVGQDRPELSILQLSPELALGAADIVREETKIFISTKLLILRKNIKNSPRILLD